MLYGYVYVQGLLADIKAKLAAPVQGQGMVEYGLIIVAVALVAIVGLGLAGDAISGLFNDISGQLVAPDTGGGQ